MILDKEVEIKIGSHNTQYYENLGYTIPRRVDKHGNYSVPKGSTIIVKSEDIYPHSHAKVNVKCDYCGKKYIMEYREYYKKIEKFGALACSNCGKIHYKKTMQNLYGVDNGFQLDQIKEKSKNTSLEKYGVEYPSQSLEVKDKVKTTVLERYGVDCVFKDPEVYKKSKDTLFEHYGVYSPSQNKEIRERIMETNISRYGVPNPMQNTDIVEKTKQTNIEKYGVSSPTKTEDVKEKIKNTVRERYGVDCFLQSEEYKTKTNQTYLEKYGCHPMEVPEIRQKVIDTTFSRYGVEYYTQTQEYREKVKQTSRQKYGVDHPFQNPDIRAKARKTMFQNSNIRASRQQVYINNLYDGILNYPVDHIAVDILLDKICIEYDGGGHDIQVRLNEMDQSTYLKKEKKREDYLLSNGYKIMRIISCDDKIPSDETLLRMLNDAKEYLSQDATTRICFNVSDGTYFTEYNTDAILYNYGKLRRIKEKDIKQKEVNNNT